MLANIHQGGSSLNNSHGACIKGSKTLSFDGDISNDANNVNSMPGQYDDGITATNHNEGGHTTHDVAIALITDTSEDGLNELGGHDAAATPMGSKTPVQTAKPVWADSANPNHTFSFNQLNLLLLSCIQKCKQKCHQTCYSHAPMPATVPIPTPAPEAIPSMALDTLCDTIMLPAPLADPL